MSSATEELRSYAILAKLVAAFPENLSEECIEAILQSPGDVNYSIPRNEQLQFLNRVLRPATVLHQLNNLSESIVIKIFKLLLRHGVDIIKKNSEGQTALHAQTVHCSEGVRRDYRIIETILNNPRDDSNGVTHFHAACMKNHARVVSFFLENGVDVDQAINRNSKLFPGCTPLHLAAYHSFPETAKELIEHGSDVHLKDAEGLTALQVLVRKNLEIARSKSYGGELGQDYKVNEEMVRLLLTTEHFCREKASPIVASEDGFTNFHAACSLDDVALAKSLLSQVEDIDQAVSEQSPFCPGYSALHFATHFSVDLVKLLLDEQANLLARDVSGVTPLDVCAQRCSGEDLLVILSRLPSLKGITFSDDKTKLLDLLRAMQSVTSYEGFLDQLADINCRLDEASPAWAGYTPLHFAVLFFEQVKAQFGRNDRSAIGICLDRGANCCTRDARGSSPLHLAFRLQKRTAISDIFAASHELIDSTDENNISHLFIACILDGDNDEHPARRLVRAGANVNLATRSSVEFAGGKFPAKSTPLHVLVAENKPETARFLIEHGADLNATDEAGWSPVHRLMLMSLPGKMIEVLFSFVAKLQDRVVEDAGLSYLHVACCCNNLNAVQLLLDLGSDANAALKCHVTLGGDLYEESNYTGYTPIHFAVQRGFLDVANALLKADADILAASATGMTPLYQVFAASKFKYRFENAFVSHLRNRRELQTRLHEDSGMTMLHVLAHVMDVEGVEKLLDAGVDVNAQLQADSPIWPGCTPLHAWFYGCHCGRTDEGMTSTLNALLRAGADVTISDAGTCTPLLCHYRGFINCDVIRSGFGSMLRHQTDFRVNPVNAKGLSHFHMSVVLEDLAAAEEFLKNGVDVNQRVDVFSEILAGCTSLHLLAQSQSEFYTDESLSARTEMLELLLSYGADVHARDVLGNTPLHALARRGRLRHNECFEILVRAGAVVQTTNIAGQTPLAAAIDVLSLETTEFYLRQGCRLNAFNAVDGTGFLATALVSGCYFQVQSREKLQLFLDEPDIKSIDDDGRTAIHNVVSTRRAGLICNTTYAYYIGELVNVGCDVDAQDRAGKSALHTAALFKNASAVEALLSRGADMNVVDANGKLAFELAWEACRCEGRHVIFIIAVHVQKMLLAQIHVCQRNRELAKEALKNEICERELQKQILPVFRVQLEETKHTDIADADPLTLRDLLIETGIVTAYPTMPLTKRLAVDRIFNGESEVLKRVPSVASLLRLQHNKMTKRAGLIESAHFSLRVLSSMSLPELICEQLTRYLSFYDVKNLIASTDNE